MKNGIYKDLSITDYHACRTHVSSTNMRKARRSLKEFKWYQDGKIEDTGSHFDFGNAFEIALIEPKTFDEQVAIIQDATWISEANAFRQAQSENDYESPRSSKIYKDRKKLFEEENKGKYFIMDAGKESFECIEEMLSSCYQDKIIKRLLKNTEYQTSIFWTDPVTKLNCRTRPDVCKINKNVIVDVKTTLDGSPEAFSRDLAKHDYPFQACMQIDGCIQSGYMKTVDAFYWLVVEKVPPYNATLYMFEEEDIKWCMDEYEYVKNRLKDAQDKNLFPGYSQRSDNKFGILSAQIPLWYRSI